MTDIQLGAEGIRFAIIMSAVVLVYMGPFRFARIAAWRQELFAIRNRLWDQMRARGTLNIPAHRDVRVLINGLIRYAPVMNLFSIAAAVLFVPADPTVKKKPSLIKQLEDVQDPRVKEEIKAALDGMLLLFLKQIFLNSFPGILVGLPLYGLFKLFQLYRWVFSRRDLIALAWAREWLASRRERFSGYAARFGDLPINFGQAA